MKINFISLGCPKNLVDSEKILGALGASGVAINSSPLDSDIIIINTCGFIKPALEETENEIRRALRITNSTNKKVYVFGCAVNRSEAELKEKYPGVAGWFRLGDKTKLLDAINARAAHIDARLPTTTGYAYLKIADGCSNHCTYCTIPQIKGAYRSYDLENLVREAYELAYLGVREIILIAQDTTRYGVERYGKPMLSSLIKEISKIPRIQWIRIMYAHPKTLTEDILSEIARNRKVCNYIDLPIQHINDRILNLMNRGATRTRIEALIKKLKDIKAISIRTTVIVGFPTENEYEFKELIDFLKEINFDWLGIFPYYREQGTQAAQLKHVSHRVIKERYNRVIRLQKRLMRQRLAQHIGRDYKTLIHGLNGNYRGHTAFSAPEIDAQVLSSAKNLKIGDFYRLKITKARGCTLYAVGTDGTD
ncbi:MAG: 30S ribosomal protein S12 methylthiotransferase RimO [candidate division WOR-3 bacterium]|nr:MAG: 30S ribosomal protein S12 methylthiotransferase RimO [candidate division WOR-3 bacterium]